LVRDRGSRRWQWRDLGWGLAQDLRDREESESESGKLVAREELSDRPNYPTKNEKLSHGSGKRK